MLTIAEQCAAYLTANKVEITELICTKTSRMIDQRTGNPVGHENCVDYKTRNTGRFADPALYEARNKISGNASSQIMRDQMSILSGRMKNPLDMVTNIRAGVADVS